MIPTIAAIVVYVAGWLVFSGNLLRARMTVKVCSTCGVRQHYDEVGRVSYCPVSGRSHTNRIPRGLFRERTGWDVAVAGMRALAWPVILIALVCLRGVLVVGKVLHWAITKAAGLTAPERDRRQKEAEEQLAETMREFEVKEAGLPESVPYNPDFPRRSGWAIGLEARREHEKALRQRQRSLNEDYRPGGPIHPINKP
jgi:hypothetical protein